jgi:hypothetical protein
MFFLGVSWSYFHYLEILWVQYFYTGSQISDSLVKELNFNICLPFHYTRRPHNFTDFILEFAKCDDIALTTLPEWLADMTELVNTANVQW